MGKPVRPEELTASGEKCLERVSELALIGLPEPQLATALATSVEVHVSRIVGRLIVLSSESSSKFGSALIDDVGDRFVRTWHDRMSWLNRGFDLQISGGKGYQDFDALVQLRNAVVHGDGRLTESQTRTLDSLLKLQDKMQRVLRVQTAGRLQYDSASAALMVNVVREFVVVFDAAVLEKFQGARKF